MTLDIGHRLYAKPKVQTEVDACNSHRCACDIKEAVELSKGCPILEVEGSVEVRPIQVFNS